MLLLLDHLRRSDFRLAVVLTYLPPINVVAKVTYRSDSSSNKCRILYLVGQLGLGGLERQLCYLLQALDRDRYKPAVVVWNYSPDDVYAHEISVLGVPIYSLPSGGSRGARLQGLRHLARRLDPEVIHSYSLYTMYPLNKSRSHS